MPTEWLYGIIAGLAAVLAKDMILPALAALFGKQSDHSIELAALRVDIENLKTKQQEHEGLLVAVTRLEERVGNLSGQLANQAPLMAQAVALAIRETFTVLGVRRVGNA